MAIGDAVGGLRWAHPRAVILQAAIDVVGISHVGAYVVELRHGNVFRNRQCEARSSD